MLNMMRSHVLHHCRRWGTWRVEGLHQRLVRLQWRVVGLHRRMVSFYWRWLRWVVRLHWRMRTIDWSVFVMVRFTGDEITITIRY